MEVLDVVFREDQKEVNSVNGGAQMVAFENLLSPSSDSFPMTVK